MALKLHLLVQLSQLIDNIINIALLITIRYNI